MKFSAAFVIATAGLVVAQPHGHHHRHAKKAPSPVADAVSAPGPTVVVYELNGRVISEDDCKKGIANGTLVWAKDGSINNAHSSVKLPSSSPQPSTTQKPTTSSVIPTTTSSVQQANTSVNKPAATSAAPSKPSYSGFHMFTTSDGVTGIDTPFPDGTVDCSDFPDQYGALPVSWLKLGGWSGIQSPGIVEAAGYNDIQTQNSNTCPSGENCCKDGMYCTYACPPGYQMMQWPSTQGATGQSVGGIQCRGGKLYKTNSGAQTLCAKGTDKVAVYVNNTLSQQVSTCRTVYPGTENEAHPALAPAGGSVQLTCPEASNYYKWQGGSTSAQIYVNPAGYGPDEACQWGTDGSQLGNFSPINFGVGYSNGMAWCSIIPNLPTNPNPKLGYTVTIVGDNVNGKCRYSNGQYCSGANYENCSPTSGCTVAATSGNVYYVLSN